MTARITVSLNSHGTVELWLNKEGRDQLVTELQALEEANDHFNLMLPSYGPSDLPLSPVPYRTTDRIVGTAKIMFRPDDWDRTHFPHVLVDAN